MFEASAQVLKAQLKPVPHIAPAAAIAGVYGVRHITDEGGKLVFQREGAPRDNSWPSGLTSSPSLPTRCSVKFKAAGDAATEFQLIRGDGARP